jgi:hypothetical protein
MAVSVEEHGYREIEMPPETPHEYTSVDKERLRHDVNAGGYLPPRNYKNVAHR